MTARSKGQRRKIRASTGLRKVLGLGPSTKERLERERVDRIGRPLGGRKTIMVINTKGGGGKTLVTLLLATYLGRYRSGSVLAWDNNETEGTLGMRAPSQPHHRTVVDLLGALPQIAADLNASTSELGHWVREQRLLGFDVLASADDDEAMRIIGEQEFEDLHTQLSRFYRMIVVDTGNNRLSPNWLAAADHADLLVFATSLKDDTSVVAAKNLDALVAMGRTDLVRNAVCVISHTSERTGDAGAGVHTREHFERWVRAVVDIPFDPMLAQGLHLDPLKIAKQTHESCMEMAAAVVDGL
jgi:MinD-like ATPase involved in chromosome partitioning or flagellar assembly